MHDCPLYDWVMDIIRKEMKKPKSVIEEMTFSDFNAPITIEYQGRKFALRIDEIVQPVTVDTISDEDRAELAKNYPNVELLHILGRIGISQETAMYADPPIIEGGYIKFMSWAGVSDKQQAAEFEAWLYEKGWPVCKNSERSFFLDPIYGYRLAKIMGYEKEWCEEFDTSERLSLEQFRASRKEVDSSADDFEMVYGENSKGYSYADGGAFISDIDSSYYLIIANMQYESKNLSELEEIAYFDHYIPEHRYC